MGQCSAYVRVNDDDFDDVAITNIGHTVAAEVGQFSQITFLFQTIRVTIFNPAKGYGLSLPVGPVLDDRVPTVTIDGEAFVAFDFVGGTRPYIRWQADNRNLTANRMTIEYHAGFGATASDIPSDLAQALMDQAGLHYDDAPPYALVGRPLIKGSIPRRPAWTVSVRRMVIASAQAITGLMLFQESTCAIRFTTF